MIEPRRQHTLDDTVDNIVCSGKACLVFLLIECVVSGFS
jgi:hypothetical protein